MSDLINKKLIDKVAKATFVHIVTIGTKPDIIKQAPLYHELIKRGETVLLFPHRPTLRLPL
ncbi:hypothetical protein IPP92_01840 [Candidatus Saccharibacteria bacterium]|nr:MAG: hypothetical protein IPP92_01840 [Candidatus Saccharibacteria bacterium]